MTVEELKDDEAAHEFLKDKLQNPYIPIYIPEEDRACSSLYETYKDSPFYKIFRDASANVDYGEELEPLTPNPFYIAEIIQYLLRYMLPFYPFWSRFVQGMLLPSEENPLTNSAVELSFKLDKEETWQRKKYHKAARFLHKTVEETEKRILEFKFETKSIRKNKKKPMNTQQEDQQKDSESRKLRDKKQEIWKRKSKRPLHGHHSKANAAMYGQKLLEKSEKIMSGIHQKKLLNAYTVSMKLKKKAAVLLRGQKKKYDSKKIQEVNSLMN